MLLALLSLGRATSLSISRAGRLFGVSGILFPKRADIQLHHFVRQSAILVLVFHIVVEEVCPPQKVTAFFS